MTLGSWHPDGRQEPQQPNEPTQPARSSPPGLRSTRSRLLTSGLVTLAPRLNYGAMALVFLAYLAAFLLVLKNKRRPAYLCFAASTLLSLLMFCYHTSSSLELNF